jgi:uncharacterized protein (DUF58 family)
MSVSRRIRLRREGWYYVCVLAFIIGGAALRQVNLLVVLAGLMVGPLIFNWRLVAAIIRQLSVKRRLPRRISAGDLLLVDLTLTNPRRRLDSWMVLVEDTIALEGASGRAARIQVETAFPHVAAGESRRQTYRCRLPRRGRYQFGPLKITSRFPLGLVQADTQVKALDTLVVCPRLGRLTAAWRMLIESERAGAQRSQRQRGLVEGEFYGLRDWRAGDTRRWIHWRTSARRQALAVRQFERQRNRDVMLLVDLWMPSEAKADQEDNVELAVCLAATAVVELCKRGGSRLTFAASGASRGRQSATTSQVFMHEVLEQLAVVKGGESAELALELGDSLLESAAGARAIVVSTRPREACHLDESPLFARDRRLAHLLSRAAWIDVSGPGLDDFFQWDAEP